MIYIRTQLTVILFLLSLSLSKLNAKNEALLKNRKILFVSGGWKNHEPEKCMELLLPWLESQGAEVDTFSTLSIYSNAEYMANVDLIIQNFSMAQISKVQERGLLKAVRNGAGLAGWHGGLADAFRNNVEYQFMVGGQWVAHPGKIIDYEVIISNTNDPITKGISNFKMHSEQYYMHVDPNVKVLATTTFSGEHVSWIEDCTMPVIWKKMYGEGRVFYSSIGHNAEHLSVPDAYEILKRGIIWSANSKYEPKEKWVSPVY